jgi:hypothetical protein
MHSPLPGGPTIPLTEGLVRLSLEGSDYVAALNFMGINQGGRIDISDPTPPPPSSSISMYYLSPTDVIPGWGGGLGVGQHWGAGLLLLGPEGTITEAHDLLDISVWNQLTTERSLSLQFGYPDTVTVEATISDLTVVPEPASCLLVYPLIIALTSRFVV